MWRRSWSPGWPFMHLPCAGLLEDHITWPSCMLFLFVDRISALLRGCRLLTDRALQGALFPQGLLLSVSAPVLLSCPSPTRSAAHPSVSCRWALPCVAGAAGCVESSSQPTFPVEVQCGVGLPHGWPLAPSEPLGHSDALRAPSHLVFRVCLYFFF